jgi:hypothetical protein
VQSMFHQCNGQGLFWSTQNTERFYFSYNTIIKKTPLMILPNNEGKRKISKWKQHQHKDNQTVLIPFFLKKKEWRFKSSWLEASKWWKLKYTLWNSKFSLISIFLKYTMMFCVKPNTTLRLTLLTYWKE